MRLLTPGNPERAFDVHGDPGIVELDPRWHQAALRFTKDGFFHILDGIDHLLFLFCLVIPFRRLRPLVGGGHGLHRGAFDHAHRLGVRHGARRAVVPAAHRDADRRLDRLHGDREHHRRAPQRRWVVTFGFGLVHGFGFSFALRESLQFAGSHLLTSLLAFNVGVELGQLLVLLVLLPVLALLFARVVDERVGTIVLSAFVAHTAWHWLAERWDVLAQYPLQLADRRRRVPGGAAALGDAGRAGGAGGVDRAAAGRAAPPKASSRASARSQARPGPESLHGAGAAVPSSHLPDEAGRRGVGEQHARRASSSRPFGHAPCGVRGAAPCRCRAPGRWRP